LSCATSLATRFGVTRHIYLLWYQTTFLELLTAPADAEVVTTLLDVYADDGFVVDDWFDFNAHNASFQTSRYLSIVSASNK
jgi:hypothetical protein